MKGQPAESLKNVFFTDRRDSAQGIAVSARRGKVLAGKSAREIIFELEDGNIWVQDRVAGKQRMLEFGQILYRIDVGSLVGNKARTIGAVQAKSVEDLRNAIEDPKQVKKRALHIVTLHRKFALPVATVIFALLAVPLGCRREPGSRARSFLISALVLLSSPFFSSLSLCACPSLLSTRCSRRARRRGGRAARATSEKPKRACPGPAATIAATGCASENSA